MITTIIKFKDTGIDGGDCVCVSIDAGMSIGVWVTLRTLMSGSMLASLSVTVWALALATV